MEDLDNVSSSVQGLEFGFGFEIGACGVYGSIKDRTRRWYVDFGVEKRKPEPMIEGKP